MNKVVVFDLDGTLLDTANDLATAVNYALGKLHLACRTVDEIKSMIGNGVEKLVFRALPENAKDKFDQAFAFFKEYYFAHSNEQTHPYDGVVELLGRLHQRYDIAVFSNKSDVLVQELVKRYYEGIVDFALGTEYGQAKKPDPFGLFAVQKYFNVEKCNVVYVGDTEVDLQTANNAEIGCICVSWGYRTAEYLVQNGAKTVCQNVNELEMAVAKAL